MTRLRAADDFAAIRARLEELRRDRAQVWDENVSEVAEPRRPRVAGNKPSPSEKPGLPPTYEGSCSGLPPGRRRSDRRLAGG
jgi:hypothetical protein